MHGLYNVHSAARETVEYFGKVIFSLHGRLFDFDVRLAQDVDDQNFLSEMIYDKRQFIQI